MRQTLYSKNLRMEPLRYDHADLVYEALQDSLIYFHPIASAKNTDYCNDVTGDEVKYRIRRKSWQSASEAELENV